MSIELEQMRQLTAAHDDPQSSIHGNIITTEAADGVFVKNIVDFRAILARMEALEKVYSDARQLTLRGARTTCRSITEIVENVNGHEWNWLLESLAEVPASRQPKGTT